MVMICEMSLARQFMSKSENDLFSYLEEKGLYKTIGEDHLFFVEHIPSYLEFNNRFETIKQLILRMTKLFPVQKGRMSENDVLDIICSEYKTSKLEKYIVSLENDLLDLTEEIRSLYDEIVTHNKEVSQKQSSVFVNNNLYSIFLDVCDSLNSLNKGQKIRFGFDEKTHAIKTIILSLRTLSKYNYVIDLSKSINDFNEFKEQVSILYSRYDNNFDSSNDTIYRSNGRTYYSEKVFYKNIGDGLKICCSLQVFSDDTGYYLDYKHLDVYVSIGLK